ncbi:MAG: nucleotidyltransferase domain-containing protein [Lachnospirales bacterium]
MYGLKESDINYIIKQVQKIDEIKKVSIFGSRAKGTYRENSDLDMVVYGMHVSKPLLYKLYELLEENAPYPFFVDIVHYESSDKILKKEIEVSSVVVYKRD